MELIRLASNFAIPTMIFFILAHGLTRDVEVYDCFVEGAKEGINTTVRILPALVGLLVAVGVFRESGAMDLIIHGLKPITGFLNIPTEVMPLALMRPISGSAALAIVADLIERYGPDSLVGRIAATMMGASETTFYTIAVYFGAVGIKDTRHTIPAALLGDLTVILASVWACNVLFAGA